MAQIRTLARRNEPPYGDQSLAHTSDIDVGDGDETFLCLHGDPTWGHLYRKTIPTLSGRGHVVIPDFIGFGRPDKFTRLEAYTSEMHYASPFAFVEALDPADVTLVGQDWGGVLGLPVAVLDHPDRFARLVRMNTSVPTGRGDMIDARWTFREHMAETTDPSISTVVRALGDSAALHRRAEQPEP